MRFKICSCICIVLLFLTNYSFGQTAAEVKAILAQNSKPLSLDGVDNFKKVVVLIKGLDGWVDI